MNSVYRHKHGWRQVLGEQFLSMFLSIGLLVGVLFMLVHDTSKEYDAASQKALDTAAFGVLSYADRLSAILMKADGVALVAARQLASAGTLDAGLVEQLTMVVQNDADISGFVHIRHDGEIADSFLFQNISPQALKTDEIVARHIDAWIEPVFIQAGDLGLRANEIAAERGIWLEDGRFAGVIIVLAKVSSPYENSPLERFLSKAKIRVASGNSDTILTNQYTLNDTTTEWLSISEEKQYWLKYHGKESLRASTARIEDDIVLSYAKLPGLPLVVYLQVATDQFFETYQATRRTAVIASVIILAVAGVLLVRIILERQAQQADKIKRQALDRRLKFALDTVGQGLWDWDIAENRGYFSDSFYRLLDIKSDAKLDIDNLRQRIHPEDRQAFDKALNEHISGRTSSFDVDARVQVGKTDRWEWFSHSGSVTERDKFDKPVHIIGLLKNIHHQKLHNLSLEFEAFHDPLTGLLNRAAFDDHIARVHAKTNRDGTPYSLVMLDIDHFKNVNDTYGHNTGDVVLQHITRMAYNALRFEEEKLFFRLGGEEFVILLPDTDGDGAHIVAERIRTKIEASPTMASDHVVPVTISAGIASYRHGEHPEDVLKRADEALYSAKKNGRNQSRLG